MSSPPPTPTPCPEIGEGWRIQIIPRETGNRIDRYWFSPCGRRFRSRAEVDRFLQNPGMKYAVGKVVYKSDVYDPEGFCKGKISKYDAERGVYQVAFANGDEDLSEREIDELLSAHNKRKRNLSKSDTEKSPSPRKSKRKSTSTGDESTDNPYKKTYKSASTSEHDEAQDTSGENENIKSNPKTKSNKPKTKSADSTRKSPANNNTPIQDNPPSLHISIKEAAQNRLKTANRWFASASLNVQAARRYLNAALKDQTNAEKEQAEALEFLEQVDALSASSKSKEASTQTQQFVPGTSTKFSAKLKEVKDVAAAKNGNAGTDTQKRAREKQARENVRKKVKQIHPPVNTGISNGTAYESANAEKEQAKALEFLERFNVLSASSKSEGASTQQTQQLVPGTSTKITAKLKEVKDAAAAKNKCHGKATSEYAATSQKQVGDNAGKNSKASGENAGTDTQKQDGKNAGKKNDQVHPSVVAGISDGSTYESNAKMIEQIQQSTLFLASTRANGKSEEPPKQTVTNDVVAMEAPLLEPGKENTGIYLPKQKSDANANKMDCNSEDKSEITGIGETKKSSETVENANHGFKMPKDSVKVHIEDPSSDSNPKKEESLNSDVELKDAMTSKVVSEVHAKAPEKKKEEHNKLKW